MPSDLEGPSTFLRSSSPLFLFLLSVRVSRIRGYRVAVRSLRLPCYSADVPVDRYFRDTHQRGSSHYKYDGLGCLPSWLALFPRIILQTCTLRAHIR